MDIIDEQMDTMGKAFMAMTIGCARCHDHKFDPIRTEDYYGMAGIFKGTKVVVHSNVSKWNERPLPMDAAQEAEAKRSVALIAEKKKAIAALKKKLGKTNSDPTPVPVASLPGTVVDDLHAKLNGAWTRSTSNKAFVGKNYIHDGAAGNSEKASPTGYRSPATLNTRSVSHTHTAPIAPAKCQCSSAMQMARLQNMSIKQSARRSTANSSRWAPTIFSRGIGMRW